MKALGCLLLVCAGSLANANAGGDIAPSVQDIHRAPSHTVQSPLVDPLRQQPLRQQVAEPSSQDALFTQMQDAVRVMQNTWFQLWIGTWPTAIDWTAAVINTLVTSSLMSMSKALRDTASESIQTPAALETQIDRYFAHNTAFYFGENAFALRNQAFDDMLWVVLGWIQSVKFIASHSTTYRTLHAELPWHGTQFVPALAHRARIFYDLAAKGWDTRLCGGGMVWNPSLGPYKNAITNQLFISASVAMYLRFPGDTNRSPFLNARLPSSDSAIDLPPAPSHNPTHLSNAIRAYDWLYASNMTNAHGLYVDGFHITGWSWRNRTGTGKCDDRNEMVYTYNQGVILSGLRGLFQATANTTYLLHAHTLVQNVISATGFSPDSALSEMHNPHWSGLGRNGLLEDYCDARGTCNQDGQTFKGIFFQHLTQLCQDLPAHPSEQGTKATDEQTRRLHRTTCKGYEPWVRRNAQAALRTRDRDGRFGMWWGARRGVDEVPLPAGAVDYRNRRGLTRDEVWTGMARGQGKGWEEWSLRIDEEEEDEMAGQIGTGDPNVRGRGRTVETQGGGLAVLRAAWEFGRL
ncbi:Mannan endo-1,6-alpha-mannosidase DCW1 [Sphaceloma murrayae]|uniref:Mannan endo-1,6-alpha-mannosidase DCW1 n=1 Tax=Sphaceloma murrayae TaxID=2082308 RepID=A0A2K1QGB7_9PEZI|nr:Mannan endo-1,6-alpha-mannosidase DCW1 [Sphaceloma murrayae]